MNREDIIRMAQEAKATVIGHEPPAFHFYLEDLERFAVLVAAAEREACANLCEEEADDEMYLGLHYAEAIRARGQA